MKSNLEMMSEIKNETYKQIEMNLPSNEFLITSLTIYDKNNSLAINLFLTNTAIFMQESSDIEKIKKRTFIKIVDIKLTSTEFYIEFQNGYKIIGDTTTCQDEVNRFFECIKANTTIRTSSSKELENENYDIPETTEIPRYNPFSGISRHKEESLEEEKKEPEFVRTLTDDIQPETSKKKKNSKKFLIIGGIVGLLAIITTIIVIVIAMSSNKKPAVSPEILMIQNRRDEILNYQLDINELYDYNFELTSYYEEYEANFSSSSKLDIEKEFNDLKKDFENKYKDKKYSSTSQAYKIYEVSKVDSWMNEDMELLTEVFDLYEEIIDEDYRDDSNIISLQSKLTTLDTKIKKTKDCLQEEKEALDKVLGINDSSNSSVNSEKATEETKTIKENNENSAEEDKNNDNTVSTEKEVKEETNNTKSTQTEVKTTTKKSTKEKDSDSEFSYENETNTKTEKKQEGKQGSAAYTGE